MNRQLSGDFSVTVDRKELLIKLKENLTTHKAHLEKALEGWRKETVENIERLATSIKSGKLPKSTYIIDQPPKDMGEIYREVISMLEMDTNEKIDLDKNQFRCLVLDKWDWQEQWSASNSKYFSKE